MAFPWNKIMTVTAPMLGAAVDHTETIGAAPAGVVTAVTYTPDAAITGAATDKRAVSLINKGQDGNGTTVVATLDFAAGVDAADFVAKTIVLSATAADRVTVAGDILAFASVHAASGIVDPGGLVTVTVNHE